MVWKTSVGQIKLDLFDIIHIMKTKNITMMEILDNPRYHGKHLMIFDGKLYITKTADEQSKILDKLWKEKPKVTPEIAFMPKGILIV